MMRIESVENVMQRINDINERFSMQRPAYNVNTGTNKVEEFARELQQAQSRLTSPAPGGNIAPKAMNNSSSTAALSFDTAGDTGAMIRQAAQRYQVDPRLVAAVAETESGGDQSSVSSAGAIGVMQLMPGTAASLGVDPYNKQQNIEGGTKYLRQMLDTFNGDVRKAVAAYNAGPQAVKDYNGIPPYRETQDYVNKVLDIYR